MKPLPKFLKRYFWDVNFTELNKKTHPRFVIERILEYGDEKAIKWMKKNFKLNTIRNVLYNSRNLSLKSANFWQFVFNLNRNKILCFKKSFQEKQKLI